MKRKRRTKKRISWRWKRKKRTPEHCPSRTSRPRGRPLRRRPQRPPSRRPSKNSWLLRFVSFVAVSSLGADAFRQLQDLLQRVELLAGSDALDLRDVVPRLVGAVRDELLRELGADALGGGDVLLVGRVQVDLLDLGGLVRGRLRGRRLGGGSRSLLRSGKGGRRDAHQSHGRPQRAECVPQGLSHSQNLLLLFRFRCYARLYPRAAATPDGAARASRKLRDRCRKGPTSSRFSCWARGRS